MVVNKAIQDTFFKSQKCKKGDIEKKCSGLLCFTLLTVLVSEKTEALHAELNERVEEATSSYSALGEFLQYVYSVLLAKNH